MPKAMHAYLIEGEGETLERSIQALVKNLKAKLFTYPVAKIEDVRSLNSFINLTLSNPTAILIRGVDEATDEALNAFLKNLEEPQENLYFILTAASHHKVLPTVVSRCQIVKTVSAKASEEDRRLAMDFLKKSAGEKISFLEPIKDREEAKQFVSGLSLGLHELLREGGADYSLLAQGLRASLLTRERLRANGNVTLQLTNMVISFG
ncbi:hypothetical protein HYT60_00075 [Candidatus Woesebacteria bacterium]|nr:hypothetical protein [Candidatus Woesebacteria bacterium]